MSTDLNDYTIIKEGEAAILMLAKNEVFFNKTQVNNRDMSIAVLSTFITRRKQEHEAFLSKRNKSAPTALDKNVSLSDVKDKPNDSDMNIETNEQGIEEKFNDDPCTTSEELLPVVPLSSAFLRGRAH
ncbi:probable tRNA (guanine(26)-N(2))-dimethyltransferase 2 [Hibiscus syriacus]|uniref:probable tRNA (guanine(26)-N(2))-dimethyltransferase 2 n=1 Tax=Hibiscus syriacus TaxID=106335 RepID=UPI001920A178|nr:probable tRNA (guanine(26)-N(2))-dimethyltransferase 2 [Hibiscus syriacus]